MDESTNSENNSVDPEKPVQVLAMEDVIKFPPLPDPTDKDFDEDITEEERNHYMSRFRDINLIVNFRLHCSACDRHLGCSPRNEPRIRAHPMLRTLMCHTCHTFYNSGEFEKGDDGSELYCRWCGQGGQVYCCSDCPHVFCAKCVKRNFGMPMIKEIEDTDDWKCFKCNTKPLWDLRAICWAVLRYCDLKNKITHETQEKNLKEAYQQECDLDRSECCRNKNRRKEKHEEKKPKQKEDNKDIKKTTPIAPKVGSTIQVKKFASINVDDLMIRHDTPKKGPQKRPASPKSKTIFVKNPVAVGNKIVNPIIMHQLPKKVRMSNPTVISNVRFNNERKPMNSYTRIRPKPTTPVMYNGYSGSMPFNMLVSDNINLSLESLTQGLDMATVAGMGNNGQDDDVVCTPDFPLEALAEGTEDNNDDDVQCIGPVVTPKVPPPLISRGLNLAAEQGDNNIIQMTENDVTVNAATGGLKFRVDPQTLSSNKMYRLPDGRIFAINANPSMPGGYSATIVAVTDDAALKIQPKGTTYAAKLSSVVAPMTPPPLKAYRSQDNRNNKSRRSTPKGVKPNRGTDTPTRDCDLNVPIEWYRYNLIDAVDALEYSLSRLNKLKQEATTMYLRTRSLNEMRTLHRRLERLLNTSNSRFNEIKDNINKEFKQYLIKKMGVCGGNNTSEDDDDVEILQDDNDNDDPIFIDENSVDSTANISQEVDLTVMGSSDHNDSNERSLEKNDGVQIVDPISTSVDHHDTDIDNGSILPDNGPEILKSEDIDNEQQSSGTNHNDEKISQDEHAKNNDAKSELIDADDIKKEENKVSEINGDDTTSADVKHNSENPVEDKIDEEVLKEDMNSQSSCDKKIDDSEMSEEMIENLLNDDTGEANEKENISMDIST
ncbi:uncharacterized protein ADD1 [Epargyreus clarus]|uniref:uncharacterized protein ADD1 n=1 Tax=Epargyreus clarus TaxID=520877 RepID=UPI003C2EB74F